MMPLIALVLLPIGLTVAVVVGTYYPLYAAGRKAGGRMRFYTSDYLILVMAMAAATVPCVISLHGEFKVLGILAVAFVFPLCWLLALALLSRAGVVKPLSRICGILLMPVQVAAILPITFLAGAIFGHSNSKAFFPIGLLVAATVFCVSFVLMKKVVLKGIPPESAVVPEKDAA